MEIEEETLDGEIIKINLSGRMDLGGVNAIEKEFTNMTAAPRMAIIVDMSGVPYMSSIGIRSLLIHAKSVSGRGGKYVLTGIQSDVLNVLQVSGIDKLITICDDLNSARQSVA
jgi:anti-anti-sigma factor